MEVIEKFPWEYIDCLNFQRNLNAKCSELHQEYIIFTEHPDTYTAGIHFNDKSILSQDVEVIRVERGGALTYHGPGQLVIYFIIDLKKRSINILNLIKIIQDSVIESLSYFNIESEGRLGKETGVWIGKKKIASIGLAIRGDCTLHGVAINVNTSLDKFKRIKPCDFEPDIMTSLSETLNRKVGMEEYLPIIKNAILKRI